MKTQELENIALHIHWAHQLYDDLHHVDPSKSGEFKELTQDEYTKARDSYPIELIPAVGIMMNIMFDRDEYALEILYGQYELDDAVVVACQTYVFG